MTDKTPPDPALDDAAALREEVAALRAEVTALGDLLADAARAGQVAAVAAAPARPQATFLSEGARLDAIEQERARAAGELTHEGEGVRVADTPTSAMVAAEQGDE